MKNLLNYLTIENIVFVVVVLAVLVGASYLIKRVLFNRTEKKRKENPFTLNLEHVGKLFKIMKFDEKNKGIAFLSFNPNRQYPSGEGGEWFNSANIPKELMKEAQVLEVIKVSDKEIKIVGLSLF